MTNSTKFLISLSGLSLLTVFLHLWLWLMIKRPEKWGRWVEAENNFWVRKGIVSASLTERVKRIETGRPIKLLVGVGALLGTAQLLYVPGRTDGLQYRKPVRQAQRGVPAPANGSSSASRHRAFLFGAKLRRTLYLH